MSSCQKLNFNVSFWHTSWYFYGYLRIKLSSHFLSSRIYFIESQSERLNFFVFLLRKLEKSVKRNLNSEVRFDISFDFRASHRFISLLLNILYSTWLENLCLHMWFLTKKKNFTSSIKKDSKVRCNEEN